MPADTSMVEWEARYRLRGAPGAHTITVWAPSIEAALNETFCAIMRQHVPAVPGDVATVRIGRVPGVPVARPA